MQAFAASATNACVGVGIRQTAPTSATPETVIRMTESANRVPEPGQRRPRFLLSVACVDRPVMMGGKAPLGRSAHWRMPELPSIAA